MKAFRGAPELSLKPHFVPPQVTKNSKDLINLFHFAKFIKMVSHQADKQSVQVN